MKPTKLLKPATIAAVVAGAGIGWVYQRFAGCPNGSCAITAHPATAMLYGAVMGYLASQLGSSTRSIGQPQAASGIDKENAKPEQGNHT